MEGGLKSRREYGSTGGERLGHDVTTGPRRHGYWFTRGDTVDQNSGMVEVTVEPTETLLRLRVPVVLGHLTGGSVGPLLTRSMVVDEVTDVG